MPALSDPLNVGLFRISATPITPLTLLTLAFVLVLGIFAGPLVRGLAARALVSEQPGAVASRGPGCFGTFAGVFTPSILTILGVVMYLRVGRVTGQVGLAPMLIIVVISHLITFSTGLSVASIATNRTVGVGGAYYIISRSLGAPAGAAIGIPLFFGQALSVTFYIVGFTESLTRLFPHIPQGSGAQGAVRGHGRDRIVLGVVLRRLGAARDVAGRRRSSHRLVRGGRDLLRRGLRGVLPGRDRDHGGGGGVRGFEKPAAPHPQRQPARDRGGPPDLPELPDLAGAQRTGERAGSGQHHRLARVAVSCADLRGSLGRDPVERGGQHPHRAAHPAGAGGGWARAAGPVLTMFFLATYGLINLACGLERWAASPSFRPEFQVPALVSVGGGIACIYVMGIINTPAMIAAALFCGFIYVVTQRRALDTTYGDARHGIWSAIVRSALQRLRATEFHPLNWRPNLLILGGDYEKRPWLLQLGSIVVQDRGIVTFIELMTGDIEELAPSWRKERRALDERIHHQFPNVFARL